MQIYLGRGEVGARSTFTSNSWTADRRYYPFSNKSYATFGQGKDPYINAASCSQLEKETCRKWSSLQLCTWEVQNKYIRLSPDIVCINTQSSSMHAYSELTETDFNSSYFQMHLGLQPKLCKGKWMTSWTELIKIGKMLLLWQSCLALEHLTNKAKSLFVCPITFLKR